MAQILSMRAVRFFSLALSSLVIALEANGQSAAHQASLNIFAAKDMARNLPQSMGPFWTPGQQEAAAAKAALMRMLNGSGPAISYSDRLAQVMAARAVEEIKLDIGRYKFQFAGVHAAAKQILIKGYCSSSAPDTIWVVGFDGGSCYFNAIFDPGLDAIVSFAPNG